MLDDAAALVLGADHVAGRVVHEQQGRVVPVRQFDELGGLLRLFAEQHAARVGEHANGVAVDLRPAGDEAGAVQRLELVEVAAVDDAGEDVARVEGGAQVLGDDAEQLVRGEPRRHHLGAGRAPGLAPAEPADDAAGESRGVLLVAGEVVGQTRDARVHVGAAERLLVGDLARRGLDQRRTGEEDHRLVLDHHHVVAHARHVGAARGGVAVHHGDGGDARLRQPREVAEQRAAGDEHLLLRGQVGAAGLDEADHRQAVLHRHVVEPQDLAQRPRVGGAALDGRVVGDEQALDALDHADTGDHGGADLEVGAPRGERAQLEERRVAVEHHVDALARGELAPVAMARDLALPAAGEGGFEVGGQLLELGLHRVPGGRVLGARGVEGGTEDGHAVYPNRRAARVVRISVVPPPIPSSRTSR